MKMQLISLKGQNTKSMIVPVSSADKLPRCANLIRQAFETVAFDFHLTSENCPSHPSFINVEKLTEMFYKGAYMFEWIDGEISMGFVAIEQSDLTKPWWYIEKLAVHPDYRHRGIGEKLMQFAICEIEKRGGTSISIALIDEQTILKNWYSQLGFKWTASKKFDHLPFGVCFMEFNLLQFDIVSGNSSLLAQLIFELDKDLRQRYGDAVIHGIDLGKADDSGVIFVLGTYGKQTTCCGALRPFNNESVELKRMFVRKQFRGKGFSKKLYYFLETLAREKSFRQVILETGEKQHEAIGLYRSLGFTPIDKFGEYVDDSNSLCFRKILIN
jgi:diamine N-acetyltransferase